MLSRSSGLIFPWATSRSTSSTIALQRSVAFISGMICSAVSRLAKDMQDSQWGRKLNVRLSDDKRDLGGKNSVIPRLAQRSLVGADFVIQTPREQPADAKHVHGRPPSPIAEPVFALAEFSRAMVHTHFHQAVAGAFDERGDETMHALER